MDVKTDVKELWTSKVEPATRREWRAAFLVMVQYCFPGQEDLRYWILGRRADDENLARKLESRVVRQVARQSIGIISNSMALCSRITQEWFKQIALYEMLKTRELGEE